MKIRHDGRLVLFVANPDEARAVASIDLRGGVVPRAEARLRVLSGGPEDENTFDAPTRVVPRDEVLLVPGLVFDHTFPPHSLTVLRIKTGP